MSYRMTAEEAAFRKAIAIKKAIISQDSNGARKSILLSQVDQLMRRLENIGWDEFRTCNGCNQPISLDRMIACPGAKCSECQPDKKTVETKIFDRPDQAAPALSRGY